MSDLQAIQQLWTDTILPELRGKMTRATYEMTLQNSEIVAIDDKVYQVGVERPLSVEWLERRLAPLITKALAAYIEGDVSLNFVLLSETEPAGPAATEVETESDQPGGPSPAGQALARINYYIAYFEKRKEGGAGIGFNQVPHPYAKYWQFLLGPAFSLWLFLISDDRSTLTKNPTTWWTPTREYSFEELTQCLNKQHPRYVAGDELECTHSREWRKEGRPLRTPADCCGGRRYELLRFKKHPRGAGLICYHWAIGLLEILARWQLVVIEINEGYKCKIQTWRMLPHLTPHQVGLLHPTIQEKYKSFLEEFGPLSDPPITYAEWQTSTEPNIVPLLPIHDMPEMIHNFDQRKNYQEFLRHAVPNPHYGETEEEEEDANDEVS